MGERKPCVRGGENALCECVCHDLPGVQHRGPCCRRCYQCGQRIKIALVEHHEARCAGRLRHSA